MPVRNCIADLQDEVTGWWRDFHQHPELMLTPIAQRLPLSKNCGPLAVMR
jgi:hypothetical protein